MIRNQLRRYPTVLDLVTAVILFIGIAVTAHYFIQNVLVQAWNQQGLLHSVSELATVVFGTSLYVHLTAVGVVLGLSIVWAFDSYKRYQIFAPLTLIVVATYASPTFQRGLLNELSIGALTLLFISVIAGLQIGGLPLIQYWFGSVEHLRSRPPASFKLAPMILFLIVISLVIVGLLDVHFRSPGGTPVPEERGEFLVNAAVGLLLTGAFYMFTRYDNNVQIITIGPARSGKTSLLGGLVADIDRDCREDDEHSKIDDIRYTLETKKEFPEVTNETTYYEFSYMTDRPVFPKRNTIGTLDYPAEEIVGGEKRGTPLSDYVDEQRSGRSLSTLTSPLRSMIPFLNSKGPWETAIAKLETKPNKPDMESLATLVNSADIVVFTIPLDDFLATAVKRGNIPSYLGLHVVEDTETSNEFIITGPDGSEDRIVRKDGKLQYAEDDSLYTDAEWETMDDLHSIDGNKYYYIDRDRLDPEQYKEEYRRLIQILNEDNKKSFAWTTTMTDLINEDFNTTYKRARKVVTDSEMTVDDQTLQNSIDRIDATGLFKQSEQNILKNSHEGRKLHAKWIQREYIETVWPEFDDMLVDTFEELVYPVWFTIDPEQSKSRFKIQTDHDQTLQGSDLVLGRFERRGLVETRSRLNDQSLTEASYRIMYAAAKGDLEDTTDVTTDAD